MAMRTLRRLSVVMAAILLSGGVAWGEGLILGETKEQLELKYDVAVDEHSSGRVSLVFTLIDEGRLKPLDEVQLVVPGQEKNPRGGHWMDLVVTIDLKETGDGNRVGRVHLRKEWAERAEIWLNTHTMDGKVDPLTRLHHVIPIAKYLDTPPAPPAAAAPPSKPAAPPPAATEKKND